MKIALIYRALPEDNPCTERWLEIMPPLWALSLATYLRETLPSVKVDILDEQVLGRARFLKKLASERYDLAGFSPVMRTYERVLEAARLVHRNGAVVVLGGHYAPVLKDEIFANRGRGSRDHCVDAIVRYDGEKAICELARGAAYKSIKNLIYQDPRGKVVENPSENLDLARLPPVDYTLADLGAYFRLQPAHSRRMVSFASQRGCKWAEGAGRCTFCGIQAKGLRALPPETAAAQLAHLYGKLGVRHVYECSDDFPADAAWLERFAAAAAGKKTPVLKIFARASSLTPRVIALLKAVRANYISLGIESMSDAVLRGVGKGASVALNRRAIALTAGAGLVPIVNLILGLPGETRATLAGTLAEMKKLELPEISWKMVRLAVFSVLPGTEVRRRFLAKEPKYRGSDLPGDSGFYDDWRRHFCGVDGQDILSSYAALEKLFADKIRGIRKARRS